MKKKEEKRIRCEDEPKLKNSVNGRIWNFRDYDPSPLKTNNVFNANKIILKTIVQFVCRPYC